MNNGFGDTLSSCASPVNRSDNVSSDTAEMTENLVEIEPEREVYRMRFVIAFNRTAIPAKIQYFVFIIQMQISNAFGRKSYNIGGFQTTSLTSCWFKHFLLQEQ